MTDTNPEKTERLAVEWNVVQQVMDENRHLRLLLWASHPCAGKYIKESGVFGCSECLVDFKHGSLAELERGVQHRSLEWLRAAQFHVCRHCGVGRMTHEATSPCRGGTHEWIAPPDEAA